MFVNSALLRSAVIVGLALALGCDSKVVIEGAPGAPEDPELARLEAELARAYPKDAPRPTKTREFKLRAAPTSVKQIDGRDLDVWAYNDQVPGPVLRVRLGEEVRIKFRNDLPQQTTIHWHGVRVPNAMDGVPGVTQDPIDPGGTFEYRFVPKDAGTFWFHPHVQSAEQVARGLYGVLIVEDPEKLPYHRDEVWVLDDWRLGQDGQLDQRFVTRHDLAHDGRWGQRVTVNGESHKEMRARPGERIRLRLANTSNGRVYQLDFGELNPQAIATDGMYTREPIPFAGRKMAPGNRIDLDITIPADAAGKRYALTNRFGRQPMQLATIRVEGEALDTPDFKPPSNPNVPRWAGAAEREVDETYVLDARRGGPHGIEWLINGKVWGEHDVTALERGRWQKFRFQNDSFRLHPMHIHGQFFKVLARNGVEVDEPYFLDTVLLERKETIDVGMVPVDWGRWLMHCHILEHAEAGMTTEIHVDE